MSGRFVRKSSFRHVHGTAEKANKSFTDIRVETSGDGNHVASNGKHIAYAAKGGGGGPVIVLSNSKPGRQSVGAPKLGVHRSKVLDFAFNPFNEDMLATASEDCHIKLSMIPSEGMTQNISTAIADLKGHEKKVVQIAWHPTASGILASAGFDQTVKVWDVESQSTRFSIDEAHTEALQHLAWNRNGSQLATCSKDKTVRFFDPRDAKQIDSVKPFAGSKKSSVVYLDNQGLIATIGFTRSSMRVVKLYDPRNFSTEAGSLEIDQSAGVLMTHYDYDTSILYVGGKGDSSIKYFEVVKTAPYLHFLTQFSDNQSQKGLCFLPKTSCNTVRCEVASALRVLRDSIVPVHFCVPRKNENFQKDLFPDTAAPIAAQTAQEYIAGGNADPKLTSMRPGEVIGGKAAPVKIKKAYHVLEAELEAANKRIAELEAQLKK